VKVTDSGTHIPTWDSGSLTPLPTRTPSPRVVRASVASDRARRSSTYGTDDDFCHIFVGSPPYRYTSCGLRLSPPVPVKATHAQPPCPNGNTPCPECTRVRAEDL
jgi:hypothetical protein